MQQISMERLYRLHLILDTNCRYSADELMERLECSRATLKRAIGYLRAQFNAPIVCDRATRLYYYDRKAGGHERLFELPGLWFTADDLIALGTFVELTRSLEPGLLKEHLEKCRNTFLRLVKNESELRTVGEKIRILPMNRRAVGRGVMEKVCRALMQERRLVFDFPDHDTGAVNRRTVSPQRLVRYRDNWYLDAYCHCVEGLRSFGVAWMKNVQVSSEHRRVVGARTLERFYAAAYGIYNGPVRATAVVRFTGPAARYAAVEQWHPRQKRYRRPDGSVELHIPYGEPTELVKDIVSWGEFAEVVSPPELREIVHNTLKRAALRYEKNSDGRLVL